MKSNSSIYSDLIKSIRTVEESNELSSEIDTLLEALFKTQGKSFEIALEKIGIKTSQILKAIFLKNNLDLGNLEFVKDFLEKLKAELTKLKIIKLTIAFEPSFQTVEHIYNWVETNLETGFILDLSWDETIIGGISIAFNGKYQELTLRKTLETFLQANQ